MIAGTLSILEEPMHEPLESSFRGGDLPALYVQNTQQDLDDRLIQSGLAASRVNSTDQNVVVGVTPEGDHTLDTERVESRKEVSTKWVADVTNSGLVAAESLANESSAFPFPFDLIMAQTGVKVEPLVVNIESLARGWKEEDVLSDVWMVGQDPGDGASIDYNDRARREDDATIGLGFERIWGGTVFRGVVYESGYAAIYSTNVPSRFISFVEDEVLPFAEVRDEGNAQVTLTESTDEEADA